MQLETEREIDGVRFRMTPLGFAKARRIFVRLTKIAGPAMAKAAPQGASDLADAMAVLTEKVSDADLEDLAETFGDCTRFSQDGDAWPFLNKANREALFSGGRLMLFFQWLAFALEVNYSDFFEWLKSAGGAAGQPSQSEKATD